MRSSGREEESFGERNGDGDLSLLWIEAGGEQLGGIYIFIYMCIKKTRTEKKLQAETDVLPRLESFCVFARVAAQKVRNVQPGWHNTGGSIDKNVIVKKKKRLAGGRLWAGPPPLDVNSTFKRRLIFCHNAVSVRGDRAAVHSCSRATQRKAGGSGQHQANLSTRNDMVEEAGRSGWAFRGTANQTCASVSPVLPVSVVETSRGGATWLVSGGWTPPSSQEELIYQKGFTPPQCSVSSLIFFNIPFLLSKYVLILILICLYLF